MKSYLEEVYIYSNDSLVGRHKKKIDGYKKYSIDINHYLTSLSRKPGALKRSLALKQAPDTLQSIYNRYFTTKPKEFIEVLKLSHELSLDKIEEAIKELEEKSLYHSVNYQNILQIIYKEDLQELSENLSKLSKAKIIDNQEIIEENSKLQFKELSSVIDLLN
ncbi:MAG: hypothetical protein GX490_05165 [Bacilli bacterium]|nr:hypothetical protein [Bacilli bacterium]